MIFDAGRLVSTIAACIRAIRTMEGTIRTVVSVAIRTMDNELRSSMQDEHRGKGITNLRGVLIPRRPGGLIESILPMGVLTCIT